MIKHGNNNGLIRRAVMAGFLALLAGCAVVPKPKPAPPAPRPVEVAPQANVLPTDADRHRVALLVPMTGAYANVGQAIANATTKALLDTNAKNLRITTYDTANGAGPAAAQAIGDGTKLILGPLNADEVTAVVAVAYARAHGITAIGAIIPAGAYGQRVAAGLSNAARAGNMRLTDIETYERTNTSVVSAIRRVKAKGQVDAILIADGARIATYAAPSANGVRLLGTELWAGESAIAQSKALRGGWFATVSDDRFGTFERSYFSRFGSHPPRVATLGYDAVLLTLNVARGWKDGTLFPTAKLYDRDGFIGIDGVFRFNEFGIAERALEVREVGTGTFVKVSPAPEHFTQNDYRQ